MCTAYLTTVEFAVASGAIVPPGDIEAPQTAARGAACPGAPFSGFYSIEDQQDRFFTWTEHFALQNGETANPLKQTEWGRTIAPISSRERAFRLSRDVGDRAGPPAPWLYIVSTDIPEDVLDEYVSWYDEEHLPRLVTVPGVRRARRYVAESGSPKFLTAYSLDERDAFTSPEGLKARKTPWTERMRGLFTNAQRFTCAFIAPLPIGNQRHDNANWQCPDARAQQGA